MKTTVIIRIHGRSLAKRLRNVFMLVRRSGGLPGSVNATSGCL
ncbi:MAG: hypothetical protein R2883_00905 [Caldisericia bacterium]